MTSCDDILMLLAASDERTLAAEEAQQLTRHLLLCDACAENAQLSQWSARPADGAANSDLPTVSPAHYRLAEPIRRGGMGKVTRAVDRRLGRDVAIKELLSAAGRQRFDREVRITARLQHPAIVPIYEAGRWPSGEPFYAMKLVIGRSLDEAIAGCGALTERLDHLCNVVSVADAIAYAHSQRIVHRDLKPANVLVGELGETVVIDWGLARDLADCEPDGSEHAPFRALDGGRTIAGQVLGTPAYMPPEQARGETVDERADVYALGAMLYHVLAGHAPYADHAGPTTADHVVSNEPTPLASIEPQIPRDLLSIIIKAMQRDPARRYTGAGELCDDLRRFQNGHLVSAYNYSIGAKLRRWAARNRTVVAVGALGCLLAAAASSIGLVRTKEHATVASAIAEIERATVETERASAEAKNNAMILARAKAELATNPTRAIAWLKTYPRAGADWDEVRLVAADAMSRGVLFKSLPRYDIRNRPDGYEGAAVSPAGDYLVTAKESERPVLIQLEDGSETELAGPEVHCCLARFAFSRSGRWLARWTNNEVDVWDMRDRSSRRFEVGELIDEMVLSPRDGFMAAASDKAIWLWDLANGHLRKIPHAWPHSLAFSADDRWLAFGDHNARVGEWNLELRQLREYQLPRSREAGIEVTGLPPDNGSVDHLDYSLDGTLAVGVDDRIYVFEGESRERRLLGTHSGFVDALVWSPNGEWLATGTELGNEADIKLLHKRWNEVRQINLEHSPLQANGLSFSEDGGTLAALGVTGIELFDIEGKPAQVIAARSDMALLGHHGSTLVTSDDDERIDVWRINRPILFGETVFDARYTGNGEELVVITESEDLVVWEPITGARRTLGRCPTWSGTLRLGGGTVACDDSGRIVIYDLGGAALGEIIGAGGVGADEGGDFQITSDGKRVIVYGQHDIASVWSTTGKRLRELPLCDVEDVREAPALRAVAPGGHWIACAPRAKEVVYALNVETGERKTFEAKYIKKGGTQLGQLMFSPDGARLAAQSTSGGEIETWVWDLEGHASWSFPSRHNSLFFPHRDVVATADSAGNLRLHYLATNEQRDLRGHEQMFQSVTLSTDAKTLVTSNTDHSVRLWSLSTPGASRALRPLRDVKSAVVSPTGLTIAERSRDGYLMVLRDDLPRDAAKLSAVLQHAVEAQLEPAPQAAAARSR